MRSRRGDPGPHIQARDLRAGYGSEAVVHGISFAVPRRRITVVLGPGGSGKTTLLRVLGAEPDHPQRPWIEGELRMAGDSMGYLPQKLRSGERSLAELLAERSTSGGDPRHTLAESWRCAPAAGEVLAPVLQTPLDRLPHTEARLAQLTAATAGAASLLLLDEPDAGLPPHCQEWLTRHILQLRRRRTIVLSTHHLKVARALADFVILLVDGEILEARDGHTFFHHPAHPRARHFVRMGS